MVRDPPRDPRRFGSRPRRDPRCTGPRPRRWAFWLRRDRDETLVRLETVSRPRRRDRDHIPANRCTVGDVYVGDYVYTLNALGPSMDPCGTPDIQCTYELFHCYKYLQKTTHKLSNNAGNIVKMHFFPTSQHVSLLTRSATNQ